MHLQIVPVSEYNFVNSELLRPDAKTFSFLSTRVRQCYETDLVAWNVELFLTLSEALQI